MCLKVRTTEAWLRRSALDASTPAQGLLARPRPYCSAPVHTCIQRRTAEHHVERLRKAQPGRTS